MTSSLQSDIDLYDHDRVNINKVVNTLRTYVGSHRDLDSMRLEIIHRFEDIGFVTGVIIYEDDSRAEPTYIFDITIIDRTETQGEFDHERQGYEVRDNILNVDQPEVKNKLSVSMPGSGGLWVPGRP